jgi:plastocyanin
MVATRIFLLSAIAAITLASPVAAQEWATIKGRFVLDGEAPAPRALDVNKDRDFCGPFMLKDETIKVDANNNLANVALWIFLARGESAPTHRMYEEKAKEQVVMTNEKCLYIPRIITVIAGQEVTFKNEDPIPHNFKVEGFLNDAFNNLVPANGVFVKTLTKEERTPMNASCAIHPWMIGKVIVRDSPYMAVSAEDGTFEIENVPVGKWNFQIWHEKPGYVRTVEIGGKSSTDRRGVIEIDVTKAKNGVLDLGDIKIPAVAVN